MKQAANIAVSLLAVCFLACQQPVTSVEHVEEPLPEIPEEYWDQGKDVAQLSQATLLSNVMKVMSEGGAAAAVSFCNIRASGITDSLSKALNCKIERVSLKNRNPDNAPQDAEEARLLNHYLELHLEGETMLPALTRKENAIIYYQPIVIGMEGCLKCHGIPQENINTETLTVLHEKYPKDKATGYRLGDFRGAWRITFND